MENNVPTQPVSPVPSQTVASAPIQPIQPLPPTDKTQSHPLIIMAVILTLFVIVVGIVLVINRRAAVVKTNTIVIPTMVPTAAPKAQDFANMAIAIRSGDATKFASVTTDIDPAKVNDEALAKFAATQDFTFDPITFKVEPEDANTAIVQANITFTDAQPTRYRVVLKSINGRWLVDTIIPIK